jgi:Cu/Ag efflux pump CusA
MNSDQNARALGFTILALNVALEETLKALAEKNGNRSGSWLEELQELALLRGQAHISERATADDTDAAKAALAVVAHIFAKTNRAYGDDKRE